MFAGASAAHGEGVGEPRAHEAFFFEAGEGGVDGADGNVVAGAAFDLLADRDSVGFISEVEEGEHDEELELAEAGFTHRSRPGEWEEGTGNRESRQIFAKAEEIDTGRWWRVCFGLWCSRLRWGGDPISVGGGTG